MPRSAHQFNRRTLLATSAAFGAAGLVAAPAMAQTGAPKPLDWVRPPLVADVALSPDGQRNATLVEENGQKSLVTYNVATAKAGKIDIGDALVESIMWVGNSHVAVVTRIPQRRLRGDAGLGSVRLANIYNVDNPNRITVFDAVANLQAGVVSGELYPIQYKGKWQLAAASHFAMEKDFAYIYAIDPDTGKGEMLDRAPRDTAGWIIGPDGALIARSAYYWHDDEWAVEYYDGKAWKEIKRVKVERRPPELVGLGRDGTAIVVNLPDDTDTGTYYELSPTGVQSEPLVKSRADSTPVFHPVTFRLIGFRHYADGWRTYDLSDPAIQALATKAQAAVPGYRMRLDGICQDPNIAIVYSEGDDDAGTWYYINFATGLTTQIATAYPDSYLDVLSPAQPFNYAAADGTPITAWLALPPGKSTTGLPLIVLPHAGTYGVSGREMSWMVQAFATAGYAVFQPNYRGSFGFGDDFLNAGNGEWGKKRQTDLSDGVAKLAAAGTIDAKRVAIVGIDLAGYMALAGVTLQKGIYRCAADVAGYSDLTAVLNQIGDTTTPSYRFFSRLFGADTDAVSPVRFASSVTVPVFIAHSQDEPGVPYQQGSRMAAALKAAGKDVTFVTTKSTDDWKAQAAWRAEVMEPLLAFLAKTNPA